MDTSDVAKQFLPSWSARNTTRTCNDRKRSKDDAEKSSSSKRKQSTPLKVVSSASDEEDGGDMVVMETDSILGSCEESDSLQLSREQVNNQVVVMQGSIGRHVPIHCMVEVATGNYNEDGSLFYQLEVDDFTLIPHDLPVSKLPKSALIQLGYGLQPATTVTGYIQLMNWKPLTLEAITDDPQVSVEYLFANLSNVATLRIQIASHPVLPTPMATLQPESEPLQPVAAATTSPSTSPEPSNSEIPAIMNDIKEKLQKLLKNNKQSVLVSHGCPFSQAMISQVIQGKYINRISSDKAKAFYKWYEIYQGLSKGVLSQPMKKKPTGYRRTRTLFDPKEELPRLRRWFRESPRPSREQMLMYLYELNNLERRKKGTLLQFSSILLWFKNARAKYKTNDFIFPNRNVNSEDLQMNSSVSSLLKARRHGEENVDEASQDLSHLEVSSEYHSSPPLIPAEKSHSEQYNQGTLDHIPSTATSSKPVASDIHPQITTGSSHAVNSANHSFEVDAESGSKNDKAPVDSMRIAESIIETATVAEALFGRRKRHRFSIHPLYEVPKLKAWFVENARPDYATKERIMHKLNSSPFRVGREKWTVKTVTVWFKNARAKMYRNELFNEHEKRTEKAMASPKSTSALGTATSRTSEKIIFPVSIATAPSGRSRSPRSSTSSDSGSHAEAGKGESINAKQVKVEPGNLRESETVAMPTSSNQAPQAVVFASQDMPSLKTNSETTASQTASKSLLTQVKVERSHIFSPFGSADSSGSSENSESYKARASLASPVIVDGSPRYLSTLSLASPANSETSQRFHSITSLASPANSDNSQRFHSTVSAVSPTNSEDSHRIRSSASLTSPTQLESPQRYYPQTSLPSPANSESNSQKKNSEQEKVFQINSSFELPKLKKCFQENPYPTKEVINFYVEMLNSMPFRQLQSQKYNTEILTAWFELERQKCFAQKSMTPEQCVTSPASSSMNSEDVNVHDSESEWTDVAVRNAVMELLKETNQSQLGQISPLTQSMVSCIVNGKYSATISKEKCEEFGKWFEEYQHSKRESPKAERLPRYVRYMPGRKLSFHPEYEVPLMKEWFGKCQHPTDSQLLGYCEIMNRDPFRQQTGRAITVTNLRIWWKNERAKRNKEARDGNKR
ncbi:uncharacterized protein [Ptychodera flava]|uniref:uncharacterized protein isoform X2 n=1 Tax=Ptychodera flava TaxID=63121 RepID=UPI00396AACBD